MIVDFFIKNGANTSIFEADCCDEIPDGEDEDDNDEDDKETEEDGDNIEDDDGDNNGNGDGGEDGGRGGSEQVASMVAGKILGLSNTSGNSSQSLVFWLGVIIMTLGVNFLGKTTTDKKMAK